MKLLLANTNPIERKRLAAALATTSYHLTEAASADIANKLVEEQRFDGAVIERHLAAALAPRLRARGRPYLVLTAGAWAPADIAAAYALGADDLLKTPAPKEEIVGRADGLGRMRARLCEMQAQSNDFTAAFGLMQTRTWRHMDELVARALGERLGATLAAVEAPTADYAAARARELPLVLAAELLEVRLAVGADPAACAALEQLAPGAAACGEVAGEVLSGLAALAGLALARAAQAEGLTLAAGPPGDSALLTGAPARTRRWLARAPSGLTLAFAASIASIAPRAIPAGALCEGMVIARDVTNPAGLLLASAGTHLTRSAAERLANLAGQQTLVEVTEAPHNAPVAAAPAPAEPMPTAAPPAPAVPASRHRVNGTAPPGRASAGS